MADYVDTDALRRMAAHGAGGGKPLIELADEIDRLRAQRGACREALDEWLEADGNLTVALERLIDRLAEALNYSGGLR